MPNCQDYVPAALDADKRGHRGRLKTRRTIKDLQTPVASIIVVNWNGREHLADCLDSLAEQTYRDFEVILVDNGSHDDSVPYVQDKYSWVKLVSLPRNIGFASGNNRGLEHACGDYIVTLNNDTRACPDWLERLVRALSLIHISEPTRRH